MTKKYDIAILGATGMVGESMLTILAERNFPVNKVYALASEKSEGQTVLFGKKNLEVLDVAKFDFSQVQIGLFSAGASTSAKYAPIAAAAGCVVIDNTSQFRNDEDIPLVIPEINANRIADYKKRNIIANPNCSTIQMLVALKPIYDVAGIKKITVATYQSVAGTGRAAISELIQQSTMLLNGRPITPKIYSQQIAYNVLPHIDDFLPNGFTKEEIKMIAETHKILEDDKIIVNPTAVRVPVVCGHSEAVTIEMSRPLSASAAKKLLANAPGVKVVDAPDKLEYPTPITHGVGSDEVFVGRIRNGIDDELTLNLWIVCDNVRKGAALNSIQIAEVLISKYMPADI